jgi:hypothetical protein
MPPSPLKLWDEETGVRHATFNPEELKNWLDTTKDSRLIIRDRNGQVAGILQVNSLRESWGTLSSPS